ncbi:MAG TPA: hypothetical protein VE445_02305 [Nitrososphaeraceae archaeon]|nr:hypothetical protein [Nitrososphaeraceae archaeon]
MASKSMLLRALRSNNEDEKQNASKQSLYDVASLSNCPSPFSTAVHNEIISLHLKPKRRLII